MQNLITVIFIAFLFGFACNSTNRTKSVAEGCVTPNGKKIGVTITGKTLVLDAESGKTIKELDVIRKDGGIACSPENEVFIVKGEEILNVEKGEKYPRRISGSTIVGINSKSNLVSYKTINISKKRGEELELKVEKPFDQSDDLKLFKLPLENLDAVQRNKTSFITKPVKLLKDNELLVFAGGKARELPASEEDDFDPDIWGFFKVNLDNSEITKTKAIDKSYEEASLFNEPFTDATEDGKFVAAAFSHTGGKIVFVFNTETGEEIFRNELFKNGEKTGSSRDRIQKFKSIALSVDGSKLAIAGEWDESEGRIYKAGTAITIYDVESGKFIANYKFEEAITDIFTFTNNELIVMFNDSSIAKISAEDGKNIWINQLGKR